MFDDLPMPKKLIPLDQMSIEDLEQRVIDLRAQISDRVRGKGQDLTIVTSHNPHS